MSDSVAKTALTDLSDAQLAAVVMELGGKAFQARQVSHWVWKHGVTDFEGYAVKPGHPLMADLFL